MYETRRSIEARGKTDAPTAILAAPAMHQRSGVTKG